MKGMRDSKGPITSSALKKMMKKFEATGSLASRQRSGRPQQPLLLPQQWSKRCNPCRRLLHIMQCSRNFEADRSVVLQGLESIANNSEMVSLQVAT
ncbi:hypothetical protein CEXT_229601 [Caerostris extrusa]|uniref:DUF4817 domain-containing protein n=1 Tax=Caerostris extrusa TaxID=172846 RepID=A0AAV4SVC3_CAEEX|nr:hypothetical protein CEXT_229601 [Caerostris extrusa]